MSMIVVSNFNTGLETDLEPINLDNDAFPILQDAHIERGRVQRKRGSNLLGRLRRNLTTESLGNATAGTWTFTIYSTLTTAITGEANAAIVPGSISLVIGAVTITDDSAGNLTSVTPGNTGTINYATGVITLTAHTGGAAASTITFSYYPALPVLGLEDFDTKITTFPKLVAFDTKYSYQFDNAAKQFYDTTFFKQTGVAFTFKGNNYNQFYSDSYENTMFVCNEDPGLHGIVINDVPTLGATTRIQTDGNHGLSTGDYVFINEVAGVDNLNGVSGSITFVNATQFDITTSPNSSGAYISGGFVQYLTRENAIGGQTGGIKFYTGDPVALVTDGWVNFAPPLSNLQTGSVEYLASAKIVKSFKDRLLFFAITTVRSDGTLTRYPNRMVYSQNGTPYYADFNLATVTFEKEAWYQNEVARGGFLDTPVQEEIYLAEENEDVIIVGNQFSFRKLIGTGDDAFPFYYQTINSEFGGQGTFTGIELDKGILSLGNYGFTLTTPTAAVRFDTKVPDVIFNVSARDNNEKRVTAFRDYKDKAVFFSFLNKGEEGKADFPNTILYYDYQDKNFAVFSENVTHYGYYREETSLTWATILYDTWAAWTDPWSSGSFSDRYPTVIKGNQQGFVLRKEVGVSEDHSQQITAIATDVITSPDHCMRLNDYIVIDNIISSTAIPKTVAKIIEIIDNDNFKIDTDLTPGTYFGSGTYFRISLPVIRSKMFQGFWNEMRKTRLGPAYFLLQNTGNGQVTVNLYTDQNINTIVNQPSPGVNDYMPFTQTLLTSTEPGIRNNDNAAYEWHKLGNSVIGSTFQVEITLNDTQMRDLTISGSEVTMHAMALRLNKGPIL